jgi:hypothetical protein
MPKMKRYGDECEASEHDETFEKNALPFGWPLNIFFF